MHSTLSLALELLNKRPVKEPNIKQLPSGFYIEPGYYEDIAGVEFSGFRFVVFFPEIDSEGQILPFRRVCLFETVPVLPDVCVAMCLPTADAVELVTALAPLEAPAISLNRPGHLAISSITVIGLQLLGVEKNLFRPNKHFFTTVKFSCTCLDMDDDLFHLLRFPSN